MAHSLGGIVVKNALIYSRALNAVDKDIHQISSATCACVFFGTPHIRSGKASWAQMKSQISRAWAAHSPSLARKTKSMLAPEEAEDMLRLSSDFCHEAGRMRLISCFETRVTSTDGGRLLVVPKGNAAMDMPNEFVVAIDADHIEMTKFVNRMDPVYRNILSIIRGASPEMGSLMQFAPEISNVQLTGNKIIEGVYNTHEEYDANFEERKRRFLSSLRSDWLDDGMIEDNSPGTCEWVLSSQAFQTWLSSSEKTLWIRGIAGSGKTVMAKFLYRKLCGALAGNADTSGTHIPQWISSASKLFTRPCHVLAYFLNYSSPLRKSGISVLQSLLYQILSANQELFKYVHGKALFSQPKGGNFGHYADLLGAILQDSSLGGTIIVLDALDECEPTSYQERIIEMLTKFANQSTIRLLVTSRPNARFNPRLVLDLSKSVEHVEVDIKTYVETAVKKLAVARGFTEDLRITITWTILERASENFLWVQLVLQSISKARTARMVRKRLEHLPRNLQNAYFDLLSESTGYTNVDVRRALYFVLVAEAPLKIKDLSALLALSHCWDFSDADGEEKFKKQPRLTGVKITPSLQDITESQTMNFERDFKHHFQGLLGLNETVSFAHYSVRDYLAMPTEIDKFHATFNSQLLGNEAVCDLRQVHGTVAVLCLQYMLAAFQGHSDPLNFLAFACCCWVEHARKAENSQSLHLNFLVKLLFSEKDYTSSWLDVANGGATQVALLSMDAEIAFVLTAFDLASCFGKILDVSIESLLSVDHRGRTSLHLAAANNSLTSARWIRNFLLAEGQDLGNLATRKDLTGKSPISLAAQNGHEELMELFLSSLKTRHIFDSRLFKTIADSGSVRMFETLYNNTSIKTPDQGMALLIDAAALDSVELMKRILSDHGGPKSDQARLADSGFPLLHVALRRKASQVIEYLLDSEYPLDIVDEDKNTALHLAAQEGNEVLVERFIGARVSMNCINKDGETPLHIASKIGLPAVVRALCRGGADVNFAGSSRCVPAHLAAGTGQEEIINIMFEFGSNINLRDSASRSALHIAAGAGQAPAVYALLMHGADVKAFDEEGRCTVHYAVESGNLNILYMLCEAGADLSAIDYSLRTPLHLAAKDFSAVLVRELLALQTDPNVRDLDGRTPLHYGCLSERSTVAVTRTLLENGAEVICDARGISPVHLAAERGLDAIVRELALVGADLNCKDLNGKTPLDYASNIEVTKVLRHFGAAIPAEHKSDLGRRGALQSIGFGALEDADGFERKIGFPS